MKSIPALTAFIPAGHYSFELLSIQLHLTSPQLYRGTVLFAEKTEIGFSIHVIFIKERSPSVSNFLQGRFLMSPLLGSLLHICGTPRLISKCLGNVFTSEQYKPRSFQHRITLAIIPGLSQESQPLWATATVTGWNHRMWFRAAQSCLGTGGTGPS